MKSKAVANEKVVVFFVTNDKNETCYMAKRILIPSHQLLILWYSWSKMTSPLVNCIVSYTAVNATLSVHERYFESLTLNDKLAAGWHPTSCSRPEWGQRCSLVTDLAQCKRCCLLVQCYMSSVQGAVNTRSLHKRVCFFKEYLIETRK